MDNVWLKLAQQCLYRRVRQSDGELTVGECRHFVYSESRVLARSASGWHDDDRLVPVLVKVVQHLLDAVGDSIDGRKEAFTNHSNAHGAHSIYPADLLLGVASTPSNYTVAIRCGGSGAVTLLEGECRLKSMFEP